MYGICALRLVYSEVVETNQTIRNLTCGDLEFLLVVIRLVVTGLKRTGLVYLLDLFGERGGRMVWFSMCEAPLDEWTNGNSVDVFFTYGDYGFSSMGI